MRYVIALILALALNAAANLMMKFGMKRMSSGAALGADGGGGLIGSLLSNWVLLLGLFCFATNVIFYTYALKEIRISLAYPIMVGCGFVIIALVAWRYLGESLSLLQWTGIGLIMAGVVLVAQGLRPAT